MITTDPIQTIDMLLASRGVKDYYMDFYTVPVIGAAFTTTANRGWLFLISESLPQGLEIISETHAVMVGGSPLSGFHEFTGQLLIKVPEGADLDRLDFIRIIPKSSDE